MIQLRKRSVQIIIVAVACAMVLLGSFFALTASAEEINETNPELTLIKINSDVETGFSETTPYMQDTYFEQGDGKYSLKTNAYVAWMMNDDVAFAYKKYNVSPNPGDNIEVTVTMERPTNTPSTRHQNDSAGLMFRSGLSSDSAEVFLHVRGNSIMAVYRTKDGNATYPQYTSKTVEFPVELKMTKEYNTVKLSYKSAGATDWSSFTYPIGLNGAGPLYVGIAAHSCDPDNYIQSSFSNLTVKGVGTYVEGGEDTETDIPDVEEEYVEEDAPVGPNVMLRETFSDGDLINTPASITNPVWEEPDEVKIVNLDGNRVWERTFLDQNDWVGDWTNDEWTNDYEVSVDVQFTEYCNPDPESAQNAFRLYARHTGIESYGHSHYAGVVTEGHKIGLYKLTFQGNDASLNGDLLGGVVDLRELLQDEEYSCLGDGKYHTLKMRVFDNTITVFWDNVEVIKYTDTGESTKDVGKRTFSIGNVGIGTYQTSVYVDNLTVVRLEDTFGGDYDNHIGGNWNSPIPDYILEWDE